MFATALIKLIFLSAFLTIFSICGLNDSDLSNITDKFGGTVKWYNFLSFFDGGFPALDRVKTELAFPAVKD